MRVKRNSRRKDTEAYLWDEFYKIKAAGSPTGPTAFAKHVGIHRTYLYKFPSLVAAVSAYGKETQPSISRRGGGISKAEAKKREIGARVRREHTHWQKEFPEAQRKLKETKCLLVERDELIEDLRRQMNNQKRINEYLLLIAREAGASPSELEMIKSKVD